MGLEAGDRIGDLDINNPITATDSVTEGAAHLRLIKRAVRGSFVNFEGSATNPKEVTLTEDQINDAALKSAENAFAGLISFSQISDHNGGLRIANGTRLFARNNAGDTDLSSVLITSGDNMFFGDASVPVFLRGSLVTGSHGTDEVFRTQTRAQGGLQVTDSNGVYGPVAAVHKAQTFALTQTFAARATFESGLLMNNDQAVEARDSANNIRSVVGIGNDDRIVLGSPDTPIINMVAGASMFMKLGTVNSAAVASQNDGGLRVYGRDNVAKKVGFRNPGNRSISSNGPLTQDDEGRVIILAGSMSELEVPALEQFTTMRITNFSSGDVTLQGIGGTQLRHINGSGGAPNDVGSLTLARNSVVEFWYRNTTLVYAFGNGLT